MSERRNARLLLTLAFLLGCGDDGGGNEDGGIDLGMVGEMGSADAAAATDAGPESCTSEGESRLAECGNCGMGQEVCEGGFWRLDTCLNEGVCAPGALEREDLGMCVTRARLCNATCEWGPWDQESEAGECDPGEERVVDSGECPVGQALRQTCTEECAWGASAGSCESPCGSLRSAPWYAEEVCVPEGPFIRGDDMVMEIDTPEVEITLSTFAVDRYPVSVRRYKECVAAGACTEGPGFRSDDYYDDPAKQDYPIDLSPDGAVAFCSWDGGRMLPTDAQWQKAMRGPAPRRNRWPAGPDEYDCGLRALNDCPRPPDVAECAGYLTALGDIVVDESHYGLRDPVSAVGEYVRDAFSDGWWTSAESMARDPFNDPALIEGGWRGMSHASCSTQSPIARAFENPASGSFRGFRCVREGL